MMIKIYSEMDTYVDIHINPSPSELINVNTMFKQLI